MLIGLWMTLALVFTKTLRTSPLGPGRVFTTRPRGHKFLGAAGSTISTRSFSLKLCLRLVHFCLCCIRAKNSVVQRFQNRLARYCTCLHRLLPYKSSLFHQLDQSLPHASKVWCRRGVEQPFDMVGQQSLMDPLMV